MPGRLTVREAMAAVALVGLCLAAFRVHISLGSFAFGTLSIAWMRTSTEIKRREAIGAPAGLGVVLGIFLTFLVKVAALLPACLIPAVFLAPVFFARRRSHGSPYESPNVEVWLAVSAACALLIFRVIHLWWSPRPAPSSKGDPANPDEPMEPR